MQVRLSRLSRSVSTKLSRCRREQSDLGGLLTRVDSLEGRNVIAGVFPLVTSAMFNRMTFAGASSFLGGVVSHLNVQYRPTLRLIECLRGWS